MTKKHIPPNTRLFHPDASRFYTCAGTSRSKFGAVCGNWCAFHVYILLFEDVLPPTAPILIPRGFSLIFIEIGKIKLSNGVLSSGNGAVAAKLCIWASDHVWASGRLWSTSVGPLGSRWAHLGICALVPPRLCLEDPIRPPLPKEGVTRWRGRPTPKHQITQFKVVGDLVRRFGCEKWGASCVKPGSLPSRGCVKDSARCPK